MDINEKFAVQETGVLELRDAGDDQMLGEDNQPMTIVLYGPGSKQHAKANAIKSNRLMDKVRKKGKMDESADDKTRENAEFLAACTKSFSPNIKMGALAGEALYKAVYSNISIGFIAEQAGQFLQDWANFKKPSTTSSAST